MDAESIVKEIAKRVRESRVKSGAVQADIARDTDVHPFTVLRYESGRTWQNLEWIYKFAAKYGLNVHDLLPPVDHQHEE